jgi:hypothetical protein
MFMQSRRDSSVLRSLALSFGEGLAFSVGTKLVQGAIRPAAPGEAPDFTPVVARLEQIEQRLTKVERPRDPQQLDQKVIHAIVSALETRLQEQAGHVNRRLEEQSAALRQEVKEMHREFTTTVAQVVGEQVAQRVTELETRLQDRVTAAVAPLQAELADLRERMAETEATMAEFVAAISMMCRKAAERNEQEHAAEPEAPVMAAPEPPAPPAPVIEPILDIPSLDVPAPMVAALSEPLPEGGPTEPLLDLPLPAFAQVRKPPGTWRIPVASSFLFAFTTVGLLMRAL